MNLCWALFAVCTAHVVAGCGELLNKFDTRGNASLSAVIRKQKDLLVNSAKADLEREKNWDRERNETFE
jgi:hypothetical protein